jgi:hypothetical protein
MNLNHAFGFLFVGTIFGLLPRFAPGWCPPTGLDGTSAREIWLQLMSALLIGVAVVYCAQRALSGLAAMLEYKPQRRAVAVEVPVVPAIADGTEMVLPKPVRVRGGRVLPVPAVAFRRGLIEQQRAA